MQGQLVGADKRGEAGTVSTAEGAVGGLCSATRKKQDPARVYDPLITTNPEVVRRAAPCD
jgi:hypothetical protein